MRLVPNGAARALLRSGLLGGCVALAGCAGTGPIDPGAVPAKLSPSSVQSERDVVLPAPKPVTALAAPIAPPAPAVADLPAPAVVVAPSSAASQHRDLWQRIRAGFAMPELPSPLVAEKERFYLQRPEALQRMFARGGRYLHFIVEEVEKRGMPTELALLPFVESAMNPIALSSAQAAGLWQFIPSTGKQYELSQNWWVDNRRDVVKSTQAALDYLQKIYEMHDRDWFLALASYNWGENAVARAVKRQRSKGLPTDYLSLDMPAETRHYVPKLIALRAIVLRADELGVALPDIPNRPYFATIEKTRPIDLKLAAQFAGMSVDEFVALNPAHNRPVIAASKNNEIKLPADRVGHFVQAVEKHDRENKPLASWQPYTLKAGETLEEVAHRGGVTTSELLRANGLAAGKKLLAGTQLIAPQATIRDEMQIESFVGPKVYEQITVPAVYHRVKKRDTVASVASSYGVTAEQLRIWNGSVRQPGLGASLMVRPASLQTVLTTVDGSRQVVARGAAPAPVARIEPAERVAATKAAAATTGAAPTKAASQAQAAVKRKRAPVLAKAAPQNRPVPAVFKPPRQPSVKAAPKGNSKRPRTT